MADEIAVGKNAEQVSVFIGHDGGAGAYFGHHFQDRMDGGIGRDHGERAARAHDLVHAQKQTAPDHSGRMKPSEILFLKSARLEQHHRKRVAQREHDRSAGSRREI